MPSQPTAKQFVKALEARQSDDELAKIQRYFKSGEGDYGEGDTFIGVRMGDVFALAKQHIEMQPAQIEVLLQSDVHEVRAGALSIMDKQARRSLKQTPAELREQLYDLYLRRHDRINNWDLVDLAAPRVVGDYLYVSERPRKVLYDLAASRSIWERRTAIVATGGLMRHGDVDDTFAIAELLLHDPEDLIHKAVGGWVRHAGKRDRPQLLRFLDAHAATMPRTMLRYAIEHLDDRQRKHYMELAKA